LQFYPLLPEKRGMTATGINLCAIISQTKIERITSKTDPGPEVRPQAFKPESRDSISA
jgi:hypothetical protein